jgi:hypothetical protein
MLEKDHRTEGTYEGLCQFDHLSVVMQHEIENGNIIPDSDWEWISYQPAGNLEYLEFLNDQKTL